MTSLALSIVFGLAVGSEHAPVLFVGVAAIITLAVWLPRFVEGLEEEDVPVLLVQPGAHGLVEEALGVAGAGGRRAVVGAAVRGPASFTGRDVSLWCELQDVVLGLRHVVDVDGVGVLNRGVLPKGKGVYETVLVALAWVSMMCLRGSRGGEKGGVKDYVES